MAAKSGKMMSVCRPVGEAHHGQRLNPWRRQVAVSWGVGDAVLVCGGAGVRTPAVAAPPAADEVRPSEWMMLQVDGREQREAGSGRAGRHWACAGS